MCVPGELLHMGCTCRWVVHEHHTPEPCVGHLQLSMLSAEKLLSYDIICDHMTQVRTCQAEKAWNNRVKSVSVHRTNSNLGLAASFVPNSSKNVLALEFSLRSSLLELRNVNRKSVAIE